MTNALSTWLRRRHDRQLLQSLDDRLLADMGISRSEISAYVGGRRSR